MGEEARIASSIVKQTPPTERGNTPGHKQAVARLFRPESRPTRPRYSMNAPEPKLLRIADVIARVQLSKGSIAKLEKVGKFPKRIKLGGCAVGEPATSTSGWPRFMAVR